MILFTKKSIGRIRRCIHPNIWRHGNLRTLCNKILIWNSKLCSVKICDVFWHIFFFTNSEGSMFMAKLRFYLPPIYEELCIYVVIGKFFNNLRLKYSNFVSLLIDSLWQKNKCHVLKCTANMRVNLLTIQCSWQSMFYKLT